MLATRQASWNSRLTTIKTEQAGLKGRFGRGIGAPNGSGASSPAGLRTRATIDGLGQSITDVEVQMRQVGPRLDQAATRGGDAAQKLLEEDSARMNGYLQALVAELATVSQQLNEFTNGERADKTDE